MKKITPASDCRAWNTDSEISWLNNFLNRSNEDKPEYRKFLVGYIKSSKERIAWPDIDSAIVIHHAQTQLDSLC